MWILSCSSAKGTPIWCAHCTYMGGRDGSTWGNQSCKPHWNRIYAVTGTAKSPEAIRKVLYFFKSWSLGVVSCLSRVVIYVLFCSTVGKGSHAPWSATGNKAPVGLAGIYAWCISLAWLNLCLCSHGRDLYECVTTSERVRRNHLFQHPKYHVPHPVWTRPCGWTPEMLPSQLRLCLHLRLSLNH